MISIPLAPFRCPPGPYERASMIAMYLKQHKPKSKMIMLDANPDIVSKKGLFTQGLEKALLQGHHRLSAARRSPSRHRQDGRLIEGLEDVKGDVINLSSRRSVPAHRGQGRAGRRRQEVVPGQSDTFESTKHKGIHVIGDATALPSDGPPMPKSGYSANSQAKVCAMNVVNLLNGKEPSSSPASTSATAPSANGDFTRRLLAGQGRTRLWRKLAEEHPDRDVDLTCIPAPKRQTPPNRRGLFLGARNQARSSGTRRYCKPPMYTATAFVSSSVSLAATVCITALSLLRSRLLNSFNCTSR
jgi:hypothetical protein